MTDPNLHTELDEARAALEESKVSTQTTDVLIAETRASLASIKMTREANHFAEKIRAILRGNAA